MAPDCYVQNGKLGGGIGMVSVGTRRQGRAGDKQVAVPRWSPSPQQVAVPR